MKKIIPLFMGLFIFCSMNPIVFANPHTLLTNYSDLFTAVTEGDAVRAIILLDKCIPASQNSEDSQNIAGMNFTTFNAYQIQMGTQKKNVIATSIDMMVEHKTLGPVHSYLRLRIFDDNSVEVFSEYLDPKTYAKLGTFTFNCQLSNGKDNKGVRLYND
jgi:hypothetical protein